MKIFCEYCDSPYNDTLTACPRCGAPNSGVNRTAAKQPKTVSELQSWYAARGLPPAETTRFFIGENYTGPRAFGVYQDPSSGNFVVYKNKSDGSRAVRYEGTDEAYAVNELYQRLKEEIIQQKRAAAVPAVHSVPKAGSRSADRKKRGFIRNHPILFGLLCLFFGPVALAMACAVLLTIYSYIVPSPDIGYYEYRGNVYYCLAEEDALIRREWFLYLDNGVWDDIDSDELPKKLRGGRSSRSWYEGAFWDETLGATDFLESDAYAELLLDWADEAGNHQVGTGYYDYEGVTYYHATTDDDDDWYYWSDAAQDWVYSADTPETLFHDSLAQDFYYTPDWDGSTQISDFEDSTIYFDDYRSSGSSSYDSDDDWSWSGWDDDDDDYDWDDDDDWGSWDSSSSWDSDW